ncbi:MAG: ABC transporter ATP-binding protein [Bacillota bacterium]
MNERTVIKMDRVTKTYIMGEVAVEALKDTSLEIFAGELLVILGPSGSGKSTLLNIIGGMDSPTSGQVYAGGEELSSASEARLTRFRRNEVGFVFQFFNLIPDLTARENVELAANLTENPLSAEEVLEEVGMRDRMDHFPSQLSGGEQQRVSIARAVVKNPRLLICDEPTGSLDYKTGRMILGLLAKINRERGSTVVIVTHNAPIGAMAHRVARMSSGRIVEMGENPAPASPEGIEW